MKYCINGQFVARYQDPPFTLIIVIGLYLILGGYLMLKMCKLCSQAFSYTNFHIHEAYKFYSLALISILSINCLYGLVIIIARTIEHNIPTKENQEILNLEGWLILEEVVGLISIYAMNQMYILNAMTWLMISIKCDFSNLSESEYVELGGQQLAQREKLHSYCTKTKKILLYYFIPGSMLLSVFGELRYQGYSCLASKILLGITCTITYLIAIAVFMKILTERHAQTPFKIKFIWIYIIFVMIARQSYILIQIITQLTIKSSITIIMPATLGEKIMLWLYVVFISILPIFLLSYLSEKQLIKQKDQIEQRSMIVAYTSDIL